MGAAVLAAARCDSAQGGFGRDASATFRAPSSHFPVRLGTRSALVLPDVATAPISAESSRRAAMLKA
jgi:hypothetical protein